MEKDKKEKKPTISEQGKRAAFLAAAIQTRHMA